VRLSGSGFASRQMVRICFIDSTMGRRRLAIVRAAQAGWFSVVVMIPEDATPGRQMILATQRTGGLSARQPFKVEP
jgi:hypothetical protein